MTEIPRPGRMILLDGVDMEQIDLRSYRKFVSVVPQESLRDANALEFVQGRPNPPSMH